MSRLSSTEEMHKVHVTEDSEEASDTDQRILSVRDDRLDYEYHSKYTPARREWQDSLIREIIGSPTDCISSNPWLVFTGGPMGAGKTHVMRWLVAEDILPLQSLVAIDPDRIKRCMPEWKDLVLNSNGLAGSLTHKESVSIAEIAQEVALRESRNVWVDGSLRDTAWNLSAVSGIRKRFPNYRIAVLYVTAPRQLILQRTQSRAEHTGRFVSSDKIDASIEGSLTTVRRLGPIVDLTATIANAVDDADPTLVSIESGGLTRDIATFRSFRFCFEEPGWALDPWLALAREGRRLDKELFTSYYIAYSHHSGRRPAAYQRPAKRSPALDFRVNLFFLQ